MTEDEWLESVVNTALDVHMLFLQVDNGEINLNTYNDRLDKIQGDLTVGQLNEKVQLGLYHALDIIIRNMVHEAEGLTYAKVIQWIRSQHAAQS